ncbi:MAG: class I SAM-dependent methyltransferase [Chloroflexia bacterium]|nr:class I SAM-dependent methyltransferase [Chloroflexia bacterium]
MARTERQRVREIYDRRAASYDRTVGFGERLVIGGLRAALAAELRGDTLEIAIGSGLNLPGYPGHVRRAVGVDLSRGMLVEARRRGRPGGAPLLLAQMDAGHLAFRDASFDTVAISLALCTVPDPAGALREAARVCRPGGRVVLLEHVRSPIWPVALAQRVLSPLQERMLGCHLDRETDDLVRSLGFRVVKERRRLFDIVQLLVTEPDGVRRRETGDGRRETGDGRRETGDRCVGVAIA